MGKNDIFELMKYGNSPKFVKWPVAWLEKLKYDKVAK